MDPMGALAISAAIMQFVDFGTKLLTNAVDAYHTQRGASDGDLEVAQIAQDLARMVAEVDAESVKAVLRGNNPASETEQVFSRCCDECKAINTELQSHLSSLQIRGTTRLRRAKDSIAVALKKNLKTGKRVEDWTARLSNVRQQMMTAMILLLWYADTLPRLYIPLNLAMWLYAHVYRDRKVATLNQQTIAEFTDHQMTMATDMKDADQSLRKCIESIQDLLNGRNSQARTQARKMAKQLWESTAWEPAGDLLNHAGPSQSLPLGASGGDGDNAQFRKHEKIIAERIVEDLEFESLPHRHTAIPEAALKTYEWIFAEPGPAAAHAHAHAQAQAGWSSFPSWLEEGPSDKAYWITGKPGAGKSTLMKFISANPKLLTCLGVWAGAATPLLCTSFYAWNAGNRLQKSHEGFVRTMLFQCIRQRPELVSSLFPKHHASLQIWRDNRNSSASTTVCPWSLSKLIEACKVLASGSGTAYKLFILVDGLDEFEETRNSGHDELVSLLRELNVHEGVRMCVSSRPWNQFYDAFRQSPMLRLENLTREDIRRYIDIQLSENHYGFWELRQVQSAEATKLITDITSKAQGVFLWVTLVVRLLARQLRDGGSLSELQETLEDLPDDLSSFFDHIWSRIDPQYLGESSHMLQMRMASIDCGLCLYAPTLWYSLDSPETHISVGSSSVAPWQPALSRRLVRRLNSRTGGLLEVYEMVGQVDFLHRTAMEWALKNWPAITSKSEPEYDPYFALLLGEALRISPWPSNPFRYDEANLSTYLVQMVKCISLVRTREDHSSQNNSLLIQSLDCLERGLVHSSGGVSMSSDRLTEDPSGTERLSGMEFLAFVTTLARIPIVPYVKYRVQQNPSLLWFNGSMSAPSSLLGSVALGGYPAQAALGDTTVVTPKRAELLSFMTKPEYRCYLNRRDFSATLRLAPKGPVKNVLLAVPLNTLSDTIQAEVYLDPYQPGPPRLPGCFTFVLERAAVRTVLDIVEEEEREQEQAADPHGNWVAELRRMGIRVPTAPSRPNFGKIAKQPVQSRWRNLMPKR